MRSCCCSITRFRIIISSRLIASNFAIISDSVGLLLLSLLMITDSLSRRELSILLLLVLPFASTDWVHCSPVSSAIDPIEENELLLLDRRRLLFTPVADSCFILATKVSLVCSIKLSMSKL